MVSTLSAAQNPDRRIAAEGERRHLTLMFVDMVGSTAIATKLDPEDWQALAGAMIELVAEAVRRHGGYVAKLLGDGALCYFGWPIAAGNDSEMAVRAALSIQKGAAGLGRSRPGSIATPPQLRIGIHAGRIVLNREGEVFGDAAHLAARVQGAASAGTIFVTPPIHRKVAASFETADRGLFELKGIEKPLRLYEVTRARGSTFSGPGEIAAPPTPFVGRERSVAVLRAAADRAAAGSREAVSVYGEPGIGKTRLLRHLRSLLLQQDFAWLDMRGDPIHVNTPFFPVGQLLIAALRLYDRPSSDARRRAIASFLRRIGMSSEPLLEFLHDIACDSDFGAGPGSPFPEQSRSAMQNLLVDCIFAFAKSQPTVLVCENVQWFDPSTVQVIQRLLRTSAEMPLLVLLTSRERGEIDLEDVASNEYLHLVPLRENDVRRIVESVLGDEMTNEVIVRQLSRRASGVPLFAEEVSRLWAERTGNDAGDEVPETLADSLTARIDGLGPAKAIAFVAAAIGQEFTAGLVSAVAGLPSVDVNAGLVSMMNAGLVSRRRGVGPDAYAFKHTLVRDSAYLALLKADRKRLHRDVANALETLFPDQARQRPEALAHHLTEAEEWERAVSAWHEASKIALRRNGYAEAEEILESALKCLSQLPETPERKGWEVNILRDYVEVLQITRGYTAPRTLDIAWRISAAMEVTGEDATKSIRLLVRMWSAVSSFGNNEDAARLAETALDLAEASDQPNDLAAACMMKMTTCYRQGRLREAEEHFRRAETPFRSDGFNRFPGSVAQTFGTAARVAWILGDLDESDKRIDFATRRAAERDDPYDIAFALYMKGILSLLNADYEMARAEATRSIELAREHGFPQFEAISHLVLGRALAELHGPEVGIPKILAGMEGLNKTKSRVAMSMYLGWLAEARLLEGNAGEARRVVGTALDGYPGEMFFRPELLRIQGEIEGAAGNDEEAGALFTRAWDLALDMGAQAYLDRVTASMRRLDWGA